MTTSIPTFTVPDSLSSTTAASGSSGASPYSSRPTFVNPYSDHRSLSKGEQELLGEYARLAATIKRINVLSSTISSSSAHSALLSQLRVLERKMGLVLTLFKASVWAIVVEQQDAFEEAQQLQQQQEFQLQQQQQQQMMMGGVMQGEGMELGQGGLYEEEDSQWRDGEGESGGDETLRDQRYY